jgi:hypothetical protein
MYKKACAAVGNHNSFGGASLEELYPFCVESGPRSTDYNWIKVINVYKNACATGNTFVSVGQVGINFSSFW